jgi:hypothetical protein
MDDVRNILAFKKSVQVLLLAQSEKSQRITAYRSDSNQSIVSKVLRRRRETGRHTRRPGQGRKRITTPHQDQYLRLISIREGFLTALIFLYIYHDHLGTCCCTIYPIRRARLHLYAE